MPSVSARGRKDWTLRSLPQAVQKEKVNEKDGSTALFAGMAMAKEYDVVILNGRVMDPESSFDGICNVGV